MENNRIGRKVLQARKKAGIKQEALAHAVGCTGSYIAKIEGGKAAPSPIMALKLEKALRIKHGTLINEALQKKMASSGIAGAVKITYLKKNG